MDDQILCKSNVIRLERFTIEELEKKVLGELNSETLSWISKRIIYIGKDRFDKIKQNERDLVSMWDSTIKTIFELVFKSFDLQFEIEINTSDYKINEAEVNSMPSFLIKVENILVFQGEGKPNSKDIKQVKKSLKKRMHKKNKTPSQSCFPYLFCYVIAGEKIQLYIVDRNEINKTELIELSRILHLNNLNDQVEAIKCFTNIALIISGFFNTE